MRKKKLYFSILGVILTVFLILVGIGYYLGSRTQSRWKAVSVADNSTQAGTASKRVDRAVLERKIQKLAPKGVYIVIDSGKNILCLRKGTEILLRAVVSCGSGNILQEPGGKRTWVFDTPRGVFSITSEIKDPSWIKPDWAFIEEAKEIPTNPNDRIETGVLGDYALGFGDGYFIHGTLYTRLLGRNVTHGCIRVGDKDLKKLFVEVTIGTPIFIY
ncbi:MAG: L,D-transpeptidase [Candidatus Aminicenantaceae bacterium]|jgi:lipoprotein-anchoring transpeptidase ErfK/SrfK